MEKASNVAKQNAPTKISTSTANSHIRTNRAIANIRTSKIAAMVRVNNVAKQNVPTSPAKNKKFVLLLINLAKQEIVILMAVRLCNDV
jgi:hypothetical protein